MDILYILDKDAKTELSKDLAAKIIQLMDEKRHKLDIVEAGKNDIVPCLGCLYCFTKSNGICVNRDFMSEINKKLKNFDIVFYVTPIVFGQFASTIKNALDKSQPSKKDKVPFLIAIGYGDDVSDEERATFIDITKKHRGNANIIHPLFKERFEVFASRSCADNDEIREKLGTII